MIRANFTAELHCKYGQVVIADRSFGAHPFTSADEDGWLCTELGRNTPANKGEFKRVAFDFEYLKHDENRTYYNITCGQHWDYAGSRLERNSNGWLGLYGTNVVGRIIDSVNLANLVRPADHWKIETLQPWDGNSASAENIAFYLRDRFGYRVAHTRPRLDTIALTYNPFLNASELEGEVLEFNLRNIELA
jgi:hypothetical protein